MKSTHAAEYIEFNGEWHKDCSLCKAAFGASSKEGLATFFYRDKSRIDGFSYRCKKCESVKDEKKWVRPEYGSVWARRRSPEKYKARYLLNNAVASGKIRKPDYCDSCKKCCNPHGHHADYTKPLNVDWLCTACHQKEHHND